MQVPGFPEIARGQLYDALRMCSSDGPLTAGELDRVERSAEAMGIPCEVVAELHEIVVAHAALRRRALRRHRRPRARAPDDALSCWDSPSPSVRDEFCNESRVADPRLPEQAADGAGLLAQPVERRFEPGPLLLPADERGAHPFHRHPVSLANGDDLVGLRSSAIRASTDDTRRHRRTLRPGA